MFDNKSILITGGTGTFGKEFVEFIIKNYKPKKLIIYSRDELKQFLLKEHFPEKKFNFLRYFIGDVRDLERLKMATVNIDYLIHAAALKQVESSEYNPLECVKTNIHGAENIINASLYNNVKKVIALSTDKAVNPLNLYGATKLVSDKLFIAANNFYGNNLSRFSVVRYGNVSGSRGSVIPLFKSLKEKKLTSAPLTEQNMTRFWITKEEAVNFVVKSFSRMHGGEIFIPKLKSFKITDLLKVLELDKKTKVIGIKPGEKVHECLCDANDWRNTLEFKDFFIIIPSLSINIPKNFFFNTKLLERGFPVKENFCYISSEVKNLLSVTELKKLIKNLI
jgi:UDP-N-acetylglucosamine 4,6-dehydratase